MDPTAAIAVLSKLISAGLTAKGALSTLASGGFDEKDVRALQTLLDMGVSVAGTGDKPSSSMAARHLGLVASAFGQAFGRHWHQSAQFVPAKGAYGGFRRFLSKDERQRANELDARARAAAVRLREPGNQPGGKKELAIVDALTASPLETPYFRALWEAYSDPDPLLLEGEAGDPPLLMSDTTRREFERHFLLAYFELLASQSGSAVEGYQENLRDYRAKIVREMLLDDMASWGARHVFGNVERRRRDPSDPLPFLPLEEMYVEPEGVEEMGGAVDGKSKPILGLVERLLGQPGAHVVVVKADFGSGKSLTARTLASRWAEKYLKSQRGPLDLPMPVFVRCADDFPGDGFSVEQTVRRAWKRQGADFDLVLKANDDAFELPGGQQRVVVLLDGLDEVVLGERQLDVLFERLLEEATDRFKFVIFSRPGAIPTKIKDKRGISVIKLLPFQRAGGGTVLAGNAGGGNQIEQWLERWNRVTGRREPIATRALEERKLLDIAGTPILLLMIAHTWDSHSRGEKPPSLAEVYEDFFWHIARGKHEADRDRNATVFEASNRLLSVLQQRHELGEDAKAPDAMLWLMQRVAWEAVKLGQQSPPVMLRTRHVDNLVEKELGIDDAEDVIRTIRIGLLLAMQADLETKVDHVLFGHQSFLEFLVARFWADRLRKLARAKLKERAANEAALLGGRLLGEKNKGFAFLMEMVNSDPSERRPSSPVGFTAKDREELVEWCQEQVDNEEQDFGDSRSTALRGDRRPALRVAALAIGSTTRGTPGISAPGSTLRSMLAWFWALNQPVLIIAPTSNLRNAQLESVSLSKAKLEDANLEEASLRDAAFSHTNAPNINLRGANLIQSKWFDCNLFRADMRGAHGVRCDFSFSYLEAVKLDDGNFYQADFAYADLTSASLARANLERATFGAANLASANLVEAKLKSADLKNAKLDQAVLTGAVFDAETQWPEGFDPVSHGAIQVESALFDDPFDAGRGSVNKD